MISKKLPYGLGHDEELCPWCEQVLTCDDGSMWCECGYERKIDNEEDYAMDPYDHLQEDWN